MAEWKKKLREDGMGEEDRRGRMDGMMIPKGQSSLI